MTRFPAIMLSPHLDDAVLSCFSVLTAEREVEVVNVFVGLPPQGSPLGEWDRITGATDALERARERRAEDRAALAVAGRSGVNLDLLDDALSGRVNGRWPLWMRAASRVAAARMAAHRRRQRLEETLAALEPRLTPHVDIYAPAGIGHPDHVLLGDAAWRLLRDGRSVTFYADQPYCHSTGWPGWVTDDETPQVERDGTAFAELESEIVTLDDDAFAAKLDAMRRYETQFAALEGGPNRRLSNRALTGYEAFWRPRTK